MTTKRRPPPRVLAYVIAMIATAAAGLAVGAIVDPGVGDPVIFAFLAMGATIAQLAVVQAPARLSYHLSLAFVFASVVLLPAPAGPLIAVAMHVLPWIRERFAWYKQAFNIANTAISCLSAKAVLASPVAPTFADLRHGADMWAWAGLVTAATLTFAVVNHGLLAGVLHTSGEARFGETGLFRPSSFSIDALLLSVGVSIALAWRAAEAASVFAILPLLLAFRALRVPALEKATATDPKSGLYNVAFLRRRGGEVCGGRRQRDVVALALIDLDHLRAVNNRHGHLAGDAVIAGVAEVMHECGRGGDLAARFGGEEFALLMPGTTLEDALGVAEEIRRQVGERSFVSGDVMVQATVSAGVTAGRGSLDELIASADEALYRAKAEGRDRVCPAREAQLAVVT